MSWAQEQTPWQITSVEGAREKPRQAVCPGMSLLPRDGSDNILADICIDLSKYKIQNVPATLIILILLKQRGTCEGKCSWREGLANPTNDKLESCRLECLWQKWLFCLRKENLLLCWANTMGPLSFITFIKITLIILFQLWSLQKINR